VDVVSRVLSFSEVFGYADATYRTSWSIGCSNGLFGYVLLVCHRDLSGNASSLVLAVAS
jgi:hypothetical protein